MTALHQLRHLAIEEGEQQGTDVCTVHVRVGHDDDAVVTQLVHIEVIGRRFTGLRTGFANARAQSRDERQNFIAGEQLFVTRFFHVQNLATQRQDGLKFTVTSLFGRTTRRVALHNVDFTQCRVFFLAIGQLAGQAHAIEHTFATRHFASLARCLTGTRSLDNLAANDLGVVGALLQIIGQCFGHDVFYGRAHFARN